MINSLLPVDILSMNVDSLDDVEKKMIVLEGAVRGGIITEQEYINAMDYLKEEYFKAKQNQNGLDWVNNFIQQHSSYNDNGFSVLTEDLGGRPQNLNTHYFSTYLNLYTFWDDDETNEIEYDNEDMREVVADVLGLYTNGFGDIKVYISKDWSKVIYNSRQDVPGTEPEWVEIKHFKYTGIVNYQPQFITDY